jgi:L-ascorbate metabolism protein UlaG (beta-lactamase superfamily)
MKITYYGHSCFGVHTGKHDLLFDPFVTPNELASKIDINAIPAEFILVSHGHQDHLADLMHIAQRTKAIVIGVWEIYVWVTSQGHSNAHAMNTGGKWNFNFGRVHVVNAIHSSSFPDGKYAGNPVGFVIQAEGKTFYYSGDTALTYDMKLLKEVYGYQFDIVFLPIGGNFTMDYHDAIVAADFLGVNKVFGLHYDTFDPIKIDRQAAIAAFKAAGKELILLDIGSSMEI